MGPDPDLALSRTLLAWTSTEEGISCQDEAYLADLSTRRRLMLKRTGPCAGWTVGGHDLILLKDGSLWRITGPANDRAAQWCPGGRVKRCLFIANGLWPIDVDGLRILAERRATSRKLRVLSVSGRVLQILPIANEDGAMLRGQMVYVQRGRTLTRYDMLRRRVSRLGIVGKPGDIVELDDIRGGFAAYVLNGNAISLLRLQDGRQRSVAIQRVSGYDLWAADAAAFEDAGLYYQYTEQHETKSAVVDRTIVRFVSQKQIHDLFSGS